MNDKTHSAIKNKSAIFYGLISGYFIAAFVTELIQSGAARLLGADPVSIDFNYIYLTAVFNVKLISGIEAVIILLMPVLICMIFLEALLYLMKFILGGLKHTIITCTLLLTGYLFAYLIYGGISSLLSTDSGSDLAKFINYFSIDFPQNILAVFFTVLILGFYINIVVKRISYYTQLNIGNTNDRHQK
ncbi:MAG: hypothetical protein JW995_13475 [Melioribacteraceae bacterium]|nr:hypothetical protein [Melioribacteraceae bacterium]